ncbi:YbgC/FadM family acyl-CoA thioesterase [Pedobacter sp. HMF7647]|uniref:YbgC/FadM family acyl-CoA thioesterase n=1 Tax=Hufsiella arboris TaxID=2695275 RepID=A0A7K1Y792_9SPHI|nr:thioesterase family protein [Hufsiella arboris]MXV50442.1 YbgC/FadM family acyl-CoA thioesterase [Hufsiella arboris]
MFVVETSLRVRYGETDQMGYMYYGNYASFYEVGRVEMLRSIGMTYCGMEESGVMMPVLELKCKYIKPAYYDENIRIKVILEKIPTARIVFKYELYNEKDELINIGETTLVFIDMERNRPCAPPKDFMEKLKPHFT